MTTGFSAKRTLEWIANGRTDGCRVAAYSLILAVVVSRRVEDRRDVRNRRLDVFRALMSNRKSPASAERVRALNLVEIEFYGVEKIQAAFQALMGHVNVPSPLPPGWNEQQQRLMTKLLAEMAVTLDYKLEQLDVLAGGYFPQGQADLEIDQQTLRQALIEVCTGKRALWMNQVTPTPANIYPTPPPPPKAEE